MMSFALNAGVGRPWVGAASNKFGKGKPRRYIQGFLLYIGIHLLCDLFLHDATSEYNWWIFVL